MVTIFGKYQGTSPEDLVWKTYSIFTFLLTSDSSDSSHWTEQMKSSYFTCMNKIKKRQCHIKGIGNQASFFLSYRFHYLHNLTMSSTSSTKLFECYCDECAVSTKRKYVSNATIRYHKQCKRFRGLNYQEWIQTNGKYPFTLFVLTWLLTTYIWFQKQRRPSRKPV